MEILFNGVGYEIKFWTEGTSNSARIRDATLDSGNPNDRNNGADKQNEDY